MKSDDLLKRDFRSDEPLKKCITDITEIKAKDGKLYTSVIFDCFDLSVLGIAMSTLFAKAPKGDFVKMSEPVQVYTACQFVKGQNMALIYFQLGNNSAMPPVSNSSTSRNTLFPYLNLCPTWVQVKLRVLTIEPVHKSGTSQRAGTVLLANLARSYFYSRRAVGKLYGNFRPT